MCPPGVPPPGGVGLVCRPEEGLVCRPEEGLVCRPEEGLVCRPEEGLVCRPEEGLVCLPQERIWCAFPKRESGVPPLKGSVWCALSRRGISGVPPPSIILLYSPRGVALVPSRLINKLLEKQL